MCDVTLSPTWYLEDRRRARVKHRCTACRETIEPRSVYVRCVGVWDGDLDVVIHCERCHALFEVLVQRDRDFPVAVALDCGELAESDDPAQWLAFALPGDPELALRLDCAGRPR